MVEAKVVSLLESVGQETTRGGNTIVYGAEKKFVCRVVPQNTMIEVTHMKIGVFADFRHLSDTAAIF